MVSDNISGAKGGGLIWLFLLPGKIGQWTMYMGVGSLKSYGKIRAQTRLARSTIMTWLYSIISWLGLAVYIVHLFAEP